jgi:hypothetical protein
MTDQPQSKPEKASTQQSLQAPSPKPIPQPMTQEAAAIVLDELHSFGRALRNLITERENKINMLARQDRERLADDLALAAVATNKARK